MLRPRLTILQSTDPPDGTTRYIDQVVTNAPDEVRFKYFSWRTVFFTDFDVFHVHWPESLIRSPRWHSRVLRRIALLALLLKFRVTGTPIVQTMHNLKPHEPGVSVEAKLLRLLDRSTSVFVRINSATESDPSRTHTILHGHYRDRFSVYSRPPAIRGRLLHFGLIRPYKGVERLVEVFRALEDGDLQLRIVGKPSGELRTVVQKACAADQRITSRLEFVPDEDLVNEVSLSELVVLPYREMHNSGALLVALSLNRPVLVPRTETSELLAAEVGPDWIFLFDGILDRADIDEAINKIRLRQNQSGPSLDGRDWITVGEKYYVAYVDAVSRARRGKK